MSKSIMHLWNLKKKKKKHLHLCKQICLLQMWNQNYTTVFVLSFESQNSEPTRQNNILILYFLNLIEITIRHQRYLLSVNYQLKYPCSYYVIETQYAIVMRTYVNKLLLYSSFGTYDISSQCHDTSAANAKL